MTSSPGGEQLTPQKIQNKASPRSMPLLFGMTKRSLGIFLIILIGIGIYALYGWIKLPDLTTQSEELESQVDRLNRQINDLTNQVDELEIENDRYEVLNNNLNRTVGDLRTTKEGLNTTNNRLRGVADNLNATNRDLTKNADDLRDTETELKSITEGLEDESERLATSNTQLTARMQELKDLQQRLITVADGLTIDSDELNATNQLLEQEVDALEDTEQTLRESAENLNGMNDDLTSTTERLNEDVRVSESNLKELTENNNELKNKTSSLTALTYHLGNITLQQDLNLDGLNDTVTNLTLQTERLDREVDDLVAATELLTNLTAQNLTDSTNRLATLIDTSNTLVSSTRLKLLQNVECFVLEEIQLWDCDYTEEFDTQDWVKYGLTLPITGTNYTDVVNYMRKEYFAENICLNNDTNFWEFFSATHPGVTLTSDLLIDAVDNYTSKALAYYLPKTTTECGVTAEEWHAVNYNCADLSKKYLWSADESCAL